MPEPRKEFNEALAKALAALAESPEITDVDFSACPAPETILAHVRGRSANLHVMEHLNQCPTCADLAGTMKARHSIHERQRTAFREGLGAQPSASEERWKAQRKLSFLDSVKQAFEPFSWLGRPVGFAVEALVVVAIAGFGLFVWRQPQPRPLLVNNAPANVKVKAAVERIQASDAHEPGSVEKALQELQKQGQEGSRIDLDQLEQARRAVAMKKVAVTNNPQLQIRWDEVDGQLTGLQWMNQYTSLRDQVKGTAAAPEQVWNISGTEGKLTVGWDPTLAPEDLGLLKASVRRTPGLEKLTLVTPDNKTLTLDAVK
jgi:hypothetical protein